MAIDREPTPAKVRAVLEHIDTILTLADGPPGFGRTVDLAGCAGAISLAVRYQGRYWGWPNLIYTAFTSAEETCVAMESRSKIEKPKWTGPGLSGIDGNLLLPTEEERKALTWAASAMRKALEAADQEDQRDQAKTAPDTPGPPPASSARPKRGTKGALILAEFKRHPEWSDAQIRSELGARGTSVDQGYVSRVLKPTRDRLRDLSRADFGETDHFKSGDGSMDAWDRKNTRR